ncbi:MAG: hypothetical protein NVS3B21_34900 [Acidimicrobiales bacterium]
MTDRDKSEPEGPIVAPTAESTNAKSARRLKTLETGGRDLADAQRLTHIGSWTWEIETGEVSWSEELYRIFHVDQASFTPSLESFMELIHRDERDEVQRIISAALASGAPFEFDHRVASGGPERWVRGRGEVHADATGSPVRLHGTSQDITRETLDGLKVERLAARFRGVFDSSPIAIALADLQGVITSANVAFGELVGVAVADRRPLTDFIGGLTPDDLGGVGHRPSAAIGERQLHRGDGTSGWVFVTASRLDAGDTSDEIIVQIVDLTSTKAGEDALHHHGLHDELTGLPNRRLFTERLISGLHARRAGRSLAVFTIDMNHFKHVNDGLGHGCGDLVLVEVARRIQAVCTSLDTVARLGGDEFAVVGHDVRDDVAGFDMAAALRRRIGEPYHVAGNAVHVGASVGFALAPDDGVDPEALVQKSEIARHRAKLTPGGIAAFSDAEDRASLSRLGLVHDLREMVAGAGIDVAYQPIVGADRAIESVEVLARWHHPRRGPVSPDIFIPLAEQDHLIDALTADVLAKATAQHVRWTAEGIHLPTISVNASATSLRSGSLWQMTNDALNASGLAPEHLTLEITESALADSADPNVLEQIARLRTLGVALSIDDFGTGYSSLAYLRRLNFDELKIDQSFVTDLGQDERSVPIVRSLIQLAHTLGLRTVAEGVETPAAERILRELGCDLLQGYGICRPGAHDTISTYLRAATSRARRTRSNANHEQRRVLTILVVGDDDIVVGDPLRGRLETLGHIVHEAHSGTAAIERQQALQPDIIILDHLFPGMSGVEAAPLLRQRGHQGPIFLCSSLLPGATHTVTYPLDVWPVSKIDESTIFEIIAAYAQQLPRGPAPV